MNHNEKYGQNIKNYMEKAVNSTISQYVGHISTDLNLDYIRKSIEDSLKRTGIYGALKPIVTVSVDAVGCNLDVSVDFQNNELADNLIIMSPENEKTHDWDYSPFDMAGGNSTCKKCGIYKLVLLSVDYYEDERTICATSNLSCNESNIKDIIE